MFWKRFQRAWWVFISAPPRVVLEVSFANVLPVGLTSASEPFVEANLEDFRTHEFIVAPGQEITFHMPNHGRIEVSCRV